MDYANRLPRTAYMLGQYSYYLNPDLYRDLLKQYQATDYKGFAYYFERATWSELHGKLDNIGQGVKELATDFCQCVRGATKSVVNLFTPSKATKAQGPDHASHHAQSEEPAHKKARHAEQRTEQTALHCGAQFEKNIEPSREVCGTAVNQDTIPIPAACTPNTDMTDTQGICVEQTVDIPIPGPCMEVPEISEQKVCDVVDPTAEAMLQKESSTENEHSMQTRSKSKELDSQLGKNNEQDISTETTSNQDKVSISKKIVDDVLKGTVPGRETKGKSTQFEKQGNFEEALKDFESMRLSNIRDIPAGKMGYLPDGRRVNVRTDSSFETPTLEIYDPTNERKIKISIWGKRNEYY